LGHLTSFKETFSMTQELVEPLNELERAELAECEQVIERGQRTFVEVGQALMKVRDSRLYRETHGTFDAYVKERWQYAKRYANDLIASAKVIEALSGGNHGARPSSERVARPLTTLRTDEGKLDEELIQEAWIKAQEIAEKMATPHDEGP